MSYRISCWDHEGQRWDVEEEGITKWELRDAIRRMRGRGYDEPTMLIEREEDL